MFRSENLKRWILCLVCCWWGGVSEENLSAAEMGFPAKPNIIYVLADDLGYGDVGCYGQKTIQTPNLDRMAAEGMRFTDHYSGSTVCAPSRCSLMTGKHTGHSRVRANGGQVALKPEDASIPELLKKAGYATAGIGKWSLGDGRTTGHPNRKGFDYWFGYLSQGNAHNYYPEMLWRDFSEVKVPGNKVGPERRVSIEMGTYSHDLFTQEALDFVRGNEGKPFFLSLFYTIPHANNEAGRARGDGMEVPEYGIYEGRDWPSPQKGHAAMITRLDRDMGRLLSLLHELGIEKNTVVLFSSDNGPHQEGGAEVEFFDSNGRLRGLKRDFYEGGIRVPMIAWWPGTVRPGTISNHISAFWDVLPTACELASVEVPAGIDGISFLPELLGKQQQKHEYLYWEILGSTAIRCGKWKAVRATPESPLELFDLEADLEETRDLAASQPEVAERMQRLMAEAHVPPE